MEFLAREQLVGEPHRVSTKEGRKSPMVCRVQEGTKLTVRTDHNALKLIGKKFRTAWADREVES